MDNNKLDLDRERLQRLQDVQAAAIQGGDDPLDDGPGSPGYITVSVDLGDVKLVGDDKITPDNPSCCRKSC